MTGRRPSVVGVIVGTVVGAVIIAVIVAIATCVLAPHLFGGLIVQLLATLIGAVLAVAGGVYLFRFQASQADQRRRDDFRNLVRTELEETEERLKDAKDTARARKSKAELDYVQPLALEEAIKSGLFPPPFSQRMMSLARQFHIYNLKVARLLPILPILGAHGPISPPVEAALDDAATGIMEQTDHIIKNCGELLAAPEMHSQDSS